MAVIKAAIVLICEAIMRRGIKRNIDRNSNITPCIRVCSVENGACVGCKRTLEEMSNWLCYEETKKIEIMKELENR